MSKTKLSDGAVGLLRRTAAIIGCAFLLLAILADPLGLSVGYGLSRNQVAFGIAGLVFIAAGILGRRFPGVYRGTGLLLLNFLVALVTVEFLSLVMVKIIDEDRFLERAGELDEGHATETGDFIVRGRYAPYVVWRQDPSCSTESMRIGKDGRRFTPCASEDPEAFQVFLMGGSAMWGSTVIDSATIGCFLQRDLSALLRDSSGSGVAVRNFAQSGFSSTQEVIELMLQLQQGDVPDLVIFYDGFNDVLGSYANGFAGGHHSQKQIASRVEGRSPEFQGTPIIRQILQSSYTWLLVASLRGLDVDGMGVYSDKLITYRTMGVDRDSLADATIQTYLGNCEVAKALGNAYGFECLFIWQPCVWLGEKTLTKSERITFEGGFSEYQYADDPAFRDLLAACDKRYGILVPDTLPFASFTGVFDPLTEEIYSDHSGVHVNSQGNGIVAGAILEAWQREAPMME